MLRDRLAYDVAIVTKAMADLKASYPDLIEDAELLQSAVEGETDFYRVMDKIVREILFKTSLQAAATEDAKTIEARAAKFGRQAVAMRKLALDLLTASGIEGAIQLPRATVSTRRPTDRPRVHNLAELPQGFYREKTERFPLLAEIKAALDKGEDVPGATLETGETTLTIRQN